MNVLFIESSIPPNNGGVERVSWLLGNYLKKNNNDIYFAYCHLDSDLVDEMGVVKELQHERACKEELMSQILVMFRFGYFQDPKTAKKRLESGIQDDGAMDEENFAIAQMYREILRRIGPIPSEKE